MRHLGFGLGLGRIQWFDDLNKALKGVLATLPLERFNATQIPANLKSCMHEI